MKTNKNNKDLNTEELKKINGGSLEVKILSTIIDFFKKGFSPQL